MRHSIVRDGVAAGVLGATTVAVWFFIMDVVARHPLETPLLLGGGLINVLGGAHQDNAVVVIAAYTVFHYLAFIVVGLLASVIVYWAEKMPAVLAGAFILFVAIEIGFYGLSSILAQTPVVGALSALEVVIGNLLAALVMGTYMWRTHPALKGGLDLALSGRG